MNGSYQDALAAMPPQAPPVNAVAQGFQDALDAVPTLSTSPDLTSAAANSADPAATAQVLSASQDAVSTTSAVQHHAAHHGSLLGSFFNTIGGGFSAVAHVIGSGLQYMAKPLQDVQHDYRYIHDLWTKSDPVSATLATLGVIGGTAAGAWLGGPIGAKFGMDAVGELEGHLAGAGAFGSGYKQIYDQSANEKISPGRDVANLLGAGGHTDSGWGKLVSGVADTTFDFNADPLMAAGQLAGARRTALGLTDTYAARNIPAIRAFFVNHGFGGLGMQDGGGINALDRIANARSNPQYNRALGAIADATMNANDAGGAAGAVVSQFPEIARMSGPIGNAVKDLGANATRDQVMDAIHGQFLASANTAEMLGNGYGLLPSRTVLRAALSPVANAVKNIGADGTAADQTGVLAAVKNTLANPSSAVDNLTGAVAQKVRTFSGYLPYVIDRTTEDGRQVLNLSNTKFDPSDPGAVRGIYQSMRFSLGDKAAQQVAGDFSIAQQANDLDQMKLIYANGYKKMLIAAGVPDDSNLVKSLSDQIDGATDNLNGRHYGFGYTRGSEVNQVAHEVPARPGDPTDAPTTVTTDLGLWDHQAGQFSYPNFWAVKNAVRSMDKISNVLGGIDQAVADHYTNSIFKPLSLVNAGFGLRVAAAEALPAAFRYGALNMLQNRVLTSAQKHQYIADESSRILDRANAARESGDMDSFTKLTQQAQQAQVGHVTAAIAHLATGIKEPPDSFMPVDGTQAPGLLGKVAETSRGVDRAARWALTSGMTRLLHISDDDLDLASHIVTVGKGDSVWGVGRAGHQQHRLPVNSADRANTGLWLTANNKVGVRATGNYTLFNPSNEHFTDMWHGQLSNVAYDESAQNIAQDLLTAHKSPDGLTDDAVNSAVTRESNRIQGLTPTGKPTDFPFYQKGRDLLGRYAEQGPTEFAADRVDALRNLLTGQDGTFHADLADKVAHGITPDYEDVAAKPLDQAPRQVPGLELAQAGPVNWMNEAINKGFTRLVDPVINYLSREPLFFAGVKEQMPALQSMVDRGVISQDDAYQQAMYRATEGMLPQIHNVQLRSQFAAIARNVMPFYFAQEQAIRRTAYLVGKNPAALRDYMQVSTGLSDPNFVHTDANGNRSLMLPFSNVLGPDLLNAAAAMNLPVQAGLPLSFSGNMASLHTVLPELHPPGVSPLLAIPLNEIAKYFPEWSTPVKTVLGDQGFGQPLMSEIVPNSTLRNVIKGMSGNLQDKTFANAFASALTAAAAHGQLPDPNASAHDMQAFIDRVKNNTRSGFFMKAMLSLVSPLSPQTNMEDYGLRDEFYKLVADKNLTYPQALQQFIAKHGSNSISYTIAKTANVTGAFIPETQAAQQFLADNKALLEQHPSTAYFVPENASAAGDTQIIHNELVNMGLRGQETPKDFMDQMYIKAGNTQYRIDKDIHDAALKQATDPEAVKAENANWAAHVQDLKKANVIWADDFTSESRNLRALTLYADMSKMFTHGTAPDSPQTAGIKQLMDDFQAHLSALTSLPADRSGGAGRTAEKDAWQGYLATQAKEHPELQSVIDGVFKRLDARI